MARRLMRMARCTEVNNSVSRGLTSSGCKYESNLHSYVYSRFSRDFSISGLGSEILTVNERLSILILAVAFSNSIVLPYILGSFHYPDNGVNQEFPD